MNFACLTNGRVGGMPPVTPAGRRNGVSLGTDEPAASDTARPAFNRTPCGPLSDRRSALSADRHAASSASAAAIHERAPVAIQRMAQMLVDQLVEVMPELEDVSPWHQFGQRRSLDEYGRVIERRISDDVFSDLMDDD